MTKVFLTSKEVVLKNGNVLYSITKGEKQTPVMNAEFIKAQESARWVITFAELAKGKDFKGKQADSLADLHRAVTNKLADKATIYVEAPAKVEKTLSNQLAEEAMNFIKYNDEVSNVSKVNNFLQQFNVINDFETTGLFFDQGIVKLDKIYTMKEIVEAVTATIDLLK